MPKFLKILIAFLILLFLSLFFLYEADISVEEAKETLLKGNSQFVEIDGLDVHYVREGKGFPFVLVHGTGALLHTWDAWTNLLKQDYEIIRMDIPAFGLTGPRADNDYTIEMYVDYIEKFVQKLGIDSFHLAGNSLGGEIVWNYALAYPEKVGKMVLLNPAGIAHKEKRTHLLVFRLARINFLTAMVKNIGTKYFVKQALNDVFFDKSKVQKEAIKIYHQSALREGNRSAVISRLNQITFEPQEILQQIEIPTLVIWGRHDKIIDVSLAEKYENNLPNVELVIYENAGHIPMEEIPEETVEKTLKFLM